MVEDSIVATIDWTNFLAYEDDPKMISTNPESINGTFSFIQSVLLHSTLFMIWNLA